MGGGTADGAVLDRLFKVIEGRRDADPKVSRTARLFSRGKGKIAQKTGEEAVETVVAALDETPQRVVEESADLLYYLLVLWVETGIRPADVWAELAARAGVSGGKARKTPPKY
ncbi:MAG TPA: phosphoribosyl-ATP diphosphatase [Rhodospirillales bacterium]|jgi:phosphoribosyl-ATP pyrophosphohydrolase|nr:phosphoribosyl-ATP diphosphatase [Rhodospirillales bacterium]